MRRRTQLVLLAALLLLTGALPAGADHRAPKLTPPTGLRARFTAMSLVLTWNRVAFPRGVDGEALYVYRDGARLAGLPPTATAFEDRALPLGRQVTYVVMASAITRGADRGRGHGGNAADNNSVASAALRVTIPGYAVGAAAHDISPDVVGLGEVNLGGNGLGDGSVLPDEVVGRGSVGRTRGERIRSRAIVVDDGKTAIAVVSIETQGVFAAYRNGAFGTFDMATEVARRIPRLPVQNVLIASDHSHSAPDTIGAWGGLPESYFQLVYLQTVRAIEVAYAGRQLANVVAGHSDAPDLIYNQSCPEGLNQGREPVWVGPDTCPTGGKDSLMRVVQARTPQGETIATLMAYAAHATAGGGEGVHGDWPQFLSDEMASQYGGVGIAMQGAVGRTQPCRPACSFTSPANPGYNETFPRRLAIVLNYMAHVDRALATARPVAGPVAAARREIREVITSPAVLGLFTAGGRIGAKLLRSQANPWVAGNTVMTIASAMRIGGVLLAGVPGEGYPEIAFGVRDAVGGAQEVMTIGLANDQVGYLIAPAASYPIIAAQVGVNDNSIFNVSPTIGDHVMCADIELARSIGFPAGPNAVSSAAYCAPYTAMDAATPVEGAIRASGIGGISLD
ncbi:MAG TPA: hypothetical protein VNA14_03405 [Mycobacteriales bacterium]|nr:hypothetical protein [Mycobacteriales bacterium]